MNYRAILKIYAAERQLTDDETAFLNTLRKMSESERQMFVEGLQDKPHKKASRKSSKSRKAALAEQIKSTAGNKPHLGEGPVCGTCSHTEDYEDHAQPSPHYHPFLPPVSSVVPASIPASSEIREEDAGIAAGGSNG